MGAGGTTGRNLVTPGAYFVSETFDAPTNANDYDTALACFNDTDNNGSQTEPNPTAARSLRLPACERATAFRSRRVPRVVCTFTNMRKSTIELERCGWARLGT